jgi:hypothetical protein
MTSILKLTNSIEIVGEIEIDKPDYIVINKPLQINYRYFQGSVPSVSFIRYSMFGQAESITFQKRDVLNVLTAREAFAAYYTNVVDQYYANLEKIIDKELVDTTTTEQQYDSILARMSIDGATVN